MLLPHKFTTGTSSSELADTTCITDCGAGVRVGGGTSGAPALRITHQNVHYTTVAVSAKIVSEVSGADVQDAFVAGPESAIRSRVLGCPRSMRELHRSLVLTHATCERPCWVDWGAARAALVMREHGTPCSCRWNDRWSGSGQLAHGPDGAHAAQAPVLDPIAQEYGFPGSVACDAEVPAPSHGSGGGGFSGISLEC